MHFDAFLSTTLAILLLLTGKGVIARVGFLRRYSIPEALVGGVLCAAVACVLFYAADIDLSFELAARDTLLLYFFASVGLSTDIRTLSRGGRPLLILSALSIVFIILQNFTGMALAGMFGMDARAGLMTGSVALTGGVGTTIAWTPYFVDTLGIADAQELGLSANMIGLIAACAIGGPIASLLIKRHGVRPSGDAELEVGTPHGEERRTFIDYHSVLLAMLWLNFALLLGSGLNQLFALTPVNLPAFVGCLLAGILLRAGCDLVRPDGRGRLWDWPAMQPGLALLSDICLGLFLTMALMGLRLWELQPMLVFIGTVMAVQIVLVVAFILLVLFRAMGSDYESVVMCAGFGGIALGSTATAVANMTAVSREFGAAPKAFIVVPLVCGFVIDLANAVAISLMAGT